MLGIDDYQTFSLHHQIIAAHCRGMADICSVHDELRPLKTGFEALAAQHEVNASFYRDLAQKIVDEKEDRMKASGRTKWIIMSIVLVMMMMMGGIGWAQEEIIPTPELTSPLTPLPQGEGESEMSPGVVVVPGDETTPGVVVIREGEGFRARDWVLVAVIGVLALLMGTQGRTLVQPAILELSKSVPGPMLEVILAGARAGIDQAGKLVEGTETKIDDTAFLELKRGYEELERQIREIKAIAYRARDNPADDGGVG